MKIKLEINTKTSRKIMQEVFDTANRNVCWLKKSQRIEQGFFNTENHRFSVCSIQEAN